MKKPKKGAFQFHGPMLSKVLRDELPKNRKKRVKPDQGDWIDWRKVEQEENAYLRSARGLTASHRILRGGKCSPR
jgi:hypothetical protein